ncbi:MAG: hypothetical protein K9M51_03100 [Candidatus Gracilibacteria bacterium]|nr:hypothetical protein [Candidatus Gracilibacteria bacterium]
MTTHRERLDQEQLAAEVGGKLDTSEATDVSTSIDVSEKVSATVGENSAPASPAIKVAQTSGFDLSGVFDQISKFLGPKKHKAVVLPPTEVQRKKVHKSLEKEQRHLLKKVKKIQNSRRFSAAKLEQVILQIRSIQKLLEELVSAAAQRIEGLYRQYVLAVR